jgi:hypothetical protein
MATVNSFPLTTVPLADALAAASYDLHKATSTTSLAIATGAKVFTTQADKGFVAGDFVVAISDANNANYMFGTVTTYTGTTLTLNVTEIGGSGTLADWTIRTSGPVGAQGVAGPSYAATSVTSNAIASSGSKTFATQAGLAYLAGARVRASDASLPTTNWMEGVVTSYSGTSLIFTADKSLGSGTLTNWTINIAGEPGANGAGTGDVVGPAASIDSEIALYNSTTGKLIKRASTTGLLKAASGVLAAAVAGTDYYNPGGTDVALADGGTGSSTAAGALANLTAMGQGKHTIWIPAAAMTSRTTNGAAAGTVEMTTNKNMFKTLDFDTTTQEFAQFEIFFPKSWNLGTVTFQPVWSHAATTTNFGVVFGLAGVARSDDDAGDVAFGTAVTSTDTGGTTNDIYIGPESAAITIAGTPAAGDTVQFQLDRTVANGSDTLAIDARLHGIRLFYTTNAATDT